MSYPLAAPSFCSDHHLRMPRKTILENGRPADPAGPSASQGVEHGENPVETNDHPCPLNNMFPTQPGASPGQCQPYTHLLGSPLHLKWSFHPPFGDRRTCFLLPLVSISWITIPPVDFPYHPLPYTTAPPIHMIICYIIIRQ